MMSSIEELIKIWEELAPSMLYGYEMVEFRKKLLKEVSTTDLELLIYTFLSKGNNMSRIIETSSGETKRRLELLSDKLNIKSGSTVPRLELTLSRIASSVPEMVAKIVIREDNISGIICLDELRTVTNQADYPTLSRHIAMCCFIPQIHPMRLSMLNVFLLPNILFSEKINKKDEKWIKTAPREKIRSAKKFIVKANDSYVFKWADRLRLCMEFGIIKDGKLAPEWVAAAVSAQAALITSYGDSF